MENRITKALRVLLGQPLFTTSVDGAFLLDRGTESEFDHTKRPPFDLSFGGVVEDAPPVRVFADERFRVCVFREKAACDCCGGPLHWLTLELRGDGTWHHLMTMQESRLRIMQSVLGDVAAYLREGPR